MGWNPTFSCLTPNFLYTCQKSQLQWKNSEKFRVWPYGSYQLSQSDFCVLPPKPLGIDPPKRPFLMRLLRADPGSGYYSSQCAWADIPFQERLSRKVGGCVHNLPNQLGHLCNIVLLPLNCRCIFKNPI